MIQAEFGTVLFVKSYFSHSACWCMCVSREQEQKVKAQLCLTYDLVQKSPSANAAAVEASGQHLVNC